MENAQDISTAKYFMRIAKAIDKDWNAFCIRPLFVNRGMKSVAWMSSENVIIPKRSKSAVMFGFTTVNYGPQCFIRKSESGVGNAFYFLYDFNSISYDNTDVAWYINYIEFNSDNMFKNKLLFDAVFNQLVSHVSNGEAVFLDGKKIIDAHEENLMQIELDLVDSI